MKPFELRRVALFANMEPRDLTSIAGAVRSSDVRRGVTLFSPGTPTVDVSFVLDGVVRLYRRGPDGVETTTGIVWPGGLLGAAALGQMGHHLDFADALTRVRVVELPTATLIEAARQSASVLGHLLDALAARIAATYGDAGSVAQTNVSTRILRVLRQLTPPDRVSSPASDTLMRLAIRISHRDLARIVGSNRETVTRTLRSLETQGLIRREQGHVVAVSIAAQLSDQSTPSGIRVVTRDSRPC
ncbi:MAG: Crp/Fnr family transcriptional regulator [Chloroflexota bacterium]|nr:Crp/Fnr family transcriptional regulator [Chloroflexota bacterium]